MSDFARKTVPGDTPEMKKAMEEFGITRTLVDSFHYGAYRYTSLKDAVAQAKRDKPAQ